MTESNGITNDTGNRTRDAAKREVIDTRRGMFGVSGSGA